MRTTDKSTDVFGAALSRRQFVKTGGALIVGVGLVGPELMNKAAAQGPAGKNSLNASLPGSWFEIHADSTILMATKSARA